MRTYTTFDPGHSHVRGLEVQTKSVRRNVALDQLQHVPTPSAAVDFNVLVNQATCYLIGDFLLIKIDGVACPGDEIYPCRLITKGNLYPIRKK